MSKTILLAVLAISVTSAAHASFELLLVGDNGTNTLASRKIHRFEARTGTYLGSFGGFNNDIVGSWLRQSTNSLFVQDGISVTEWDYNTGALKNVSVTDAGGFRMTVRPDGQRSAIFDGFSDFIVRGFPAAIGGGTTGAVAGASYRAGLWYGQQDLMTFDANNQLFRRFQMDAAGGVATQVLNSGSLPSATFGQMARNGGTSRLVMAAGTNIKLVDTISSGASQIASPFGSSTAAAAAHNGFFIAGSSAGAGLITYYDNLTFVRTQFGGGILVNPITMETVLAPEPGTMIALGAGLAAILRRRRK